MTTVQIADLRRIANELIDHLQEMSGDSFELHEDFFWSIPFDSLYEMDAVPSHLTIGQLSETVDDLLSMSAREESVTDGLVWLGDLLRTVGGRTVSSGADGA